MNAIKETFNHRGTSFDDIAAFEDGFADDETRLMRWNSFVKKKKAFIKLGFEETVQLLKILLFPIVDAIKRMSYLSELGVTRKRCGSDR